MREFRTEPQRCQAAERPGAEVRSGGLSILEHAVAQVPKGASARRGQAPQHGPVI